MRPKGGYSLAQTFAWPLLLALLSLAALVAGLMGDGLFDVAAVIGLAVPTLLGVWKLVRALSPRRRT
jgi:hypothetical protein